jgi:hypothetical protein
MQTRASVKPKALKVVPNVQLDAHSVSKRIGQSNLIRQSYVGNKSIVWGLPFAMVYA